MVSFNPYFIGLPILITPCTPLTIKYPNVSILILLDYLFLLDVPVLPFVIVRGFNPYFIGLPILIKEAKYTLLDRIKGFNPYFIGLPILIIISTKVLKRKRQCFNPYFIGLPILIFFLLYQAC